MVRHHAVRMKNFFVLTLLLAQIGCASAEPNGTLKPKNESEFILYPGLHKLFLDPSWNFSLSDLLASVRAGNPDAICVEISPDDYAGNFEGYYPPEAAAVSEVFSETSVIIPADWRAPHREYREPSRDTTNRIAALKSRFDRELKQAPNSIEFAISAKGQAQIKEIHQTIIEGDGQEADGFWRTRNERISQTCLNQSREHGHKRVAMIFGIDHLYAIKERLMGLGYAVSDGRLTSAKQNLISQDVVRRWRKNLLALKKLRESSKVKALEIDESGRIKDLEAFVSHSHSD